MTLSSVIYNILIIIIKLYLVSSSLLTSKPIAYVRIFVGNVWLALIWSIVPVMTSDGSYLGIYFTKSDLDTREHAGQLRSAG